MITLDDCIDFCDLPPTVVGKIAEEQHLPLVMACAYAQSLKETNMPEKSASRCAQPAQDDPYHGLRAYPPNSPEAKARLLALALLADGQLEDQELDELVRRRAFAKLGLSGEAFFQVLYDFCADLAATPKQSKSYLVTPQLLNTLLAEVSEPAAQKALLLLIFDVIRSDGQLALSEGRLLSNALAAWQIPRSSQGTPLRSQKLRRRAMATPMAAC